MPLSDVSRSMLVARRATLMATRGRAVVDHDSKLHQAEQAEELVRACDAQIAAIDADLDL